MEIEFYFRFKRKPKTKKVTVVVDEQYPPNHSRILDPPATIVLMVAGVCQVSGKWCIIFI